MQGWESGPIHEVPSPRRHNRLARMSSPFRIVRHVTYSSSTTHIMYVYHPLSLRLQPQVKAQERSQRHTRQTATSLHSFSQWSPKLDDPWSQHWCQVLSSSCSRYDEPLLGYITLSINCDFRFLYALGGSLESDWICFIRWLKKI